VDTTARQEFYQRIDQQHMTAWWEVLGARVPKAPASTLQTALWREEKMA
jgi:gentisate 1,2-dioxygenase